jgi:hypothetical protein
VGVVDVKSPEHMGGFKHVWTKVNFRIEGYGDLFAGEWVLKVCA